MTRPKVSNDRLGGLWRQTLMQSRSFTDPKTGTAEIRVLELLSLLEELIGFRAAQTSDADPQVRS